MSQVSTLLPVFSSADPQIAGEGSLDPLGLAQLADRLAEHLLPGIRARMRRIRFVTAAAVGAIASDELHDLIPKDQVSTPSICFEWLVLEAFASDRSADSPLETSGVPGSAKVRAVLAQGKPLTASNYLKSPGVFGFTGVYLPLARHLEVLNEDRRMAARTASLTRAWELDHGLDGFTDSSTGEGARLRNQLRQEIQEALRAGHSNRSGATKLGKSLAQCLHPVKVGSRERVLLRSWIVSRDEPVRAELAEVLAVSAPETDYELHGVLSASRMSSEVVLRLAAIAAYEHVAWLLDAAFRQLLTRSTVLAPKPITPLHADSEPAVVKAARQLPGALRAAHDRISEVDPQLATSLDERLGRFEERMNGAAMCAALMEHHELVQAGKPPRGKLPWFDRDGEGWVVRRAYRSDEEVDHTSEGFVHPYRLSSLRTFMKDLGG